MATGPLGRRRGKRHRGRVLPRRRPQLEAEDLALQRLCPEGSGLQPGLGPCGLDRPRRDRLRDRVVDRHHQPPHGRRHGCLSKRRQTGHFSGPAFFSKTTDYGRTWSSPISIAATGQDEGTLGNQILVDARKGRLYDVYAFYFCTCPTIPKVAYVTSDDGGRTWSGQGVISDLTPVGVVQPGVQVPVRSGGFPVAAISRSGRVYVVWQDSRFSGYDEIAIASTRDRGAHWTTPHRANKPTGRPAFTPSVAVTASGKVAVTYYDLRRDSLADPSFNTDYWATTTTDGVHFSGDRHLAGSFDLLTAPFAFGLFVGDYEGLAAAGDGLVAVFSMTNCRFDGGCEVNPTDIYSARFPSRLKGPAADRTSATRSLGRTTTRHARFVR